MGSRRNFIRNAGAVIIGPLIASGQSFKGSGDQGTSTPEGAGLETTSRTLVTSSDHRYLVNAENIPFLMQGDAAWSLIAAATPSEVELYLRNRRQKGFNSIQVNLIEHKFCPHPPRNLAGEGPFTTPGDFSTPNEKYFAHADWVIRKAAENGIQVLLYPIYLGYKGTDEGWSKEALANGPEKCLNYGRFLGKRYKQFDNIIWMMGADLDPGPALTEDVDTIALGIKEYDHRHLFSAEADPEHFASDYYSAGRWLDFDTTYTYDIVHRKLLQDYNRRPTMPFILIESTYEGEHNASEVQIRRQAYWSVLCGGFGQVMGNRPIWAFDATPILFPAMGAWQEAMDLPGSVSMMYWGRFFRSRDWFNLVPDQKHEVVTSGLGEFNGLDYVAAARTLDGGTVMAYMPTSRTIGVDMSKIAGSQVKAWWFNPRTGKSSSAGEFPTTGTRPITPPTEGDWAMVLDNAARHLPAPGSSQRIRAGLPQGTPRPAGQLGFSCERSVY
jgi:Protein of unknown function (DUF4038)/Putative collagen-binding domain of a collagenase